MAFAAWWPVVGVLVVAALLTHLQPDLGWS
jgi:hypothetical protein